MEAPNEDRKSDKCKWRLTERLAGCCDALILKVVLSRAAAKSGEQMGSPSNVLADERDGRRTDGRTDGRPPGHSSLRCASHAAQSVAMQGFSGCSICMQSAAHESFFIDKVKSTGELLTTCCLEILEYSIRWGQFKINPNHQCEGFRCGRSAHTNGGPTTKFGVLKTNPTWGESGLLSAYTMPRLAIQITKEVNVNVK